MKVCRTVILAATALATSAAIGLAQMPMMEQLATSRPFYQERTFLVLVGVVIAAVGLVAFRVSRGRWHLKNGPVEFVSEAILVVDLVNSTHLATHYGDIVAMNATNAIKERTLTAAEGRGLTFAGDTGDGYFLTFRFVTDAVQSAIALLTDLRERPPDLSPGPGLEARIGISYGQIILDRRSLRHGAAINKAFRIEGVSRESFAQLEGERKICEVPERNRIFLDEDAAQELRSGKIPLRPVGFCRLKGFSGLHRIFEVLWRNSEIAASPSRE